MLIITVECPSCHTSFPVDPRKVPSGGVKVRCSVCAGIFFVDKPEPVEAAPPATSTESHDAPAGGEPAETSPPTAAEEHSGAGEGDSAPPLTATGGTEGVPLPPSARGTEVEGSTVDESDGVDPWSGRGWDDEGELAPDPWSGGVGLDGWDDDPREQDPSGPAGADAPGDAAPGDAASDADPWAGWPAAEGGDRPAPVADSPAVPEPERSPPSDPRFVPEPPAESPPAAEARPSDTWVHEPPSQEPVGRTPLRDADDSAAGEAAADPWGIPAAPEAPTDDEPALAGPVTDAEPVAAEPGPIDPAPDEPTPVEPTPGAPVAAEPAADPWGAPPAAPEPVLDPPPSETVSAPPPPAFQFGKRDPHDKAKRLARVLVSDIITYNPERHQVALERDTLHADFEDEIRKSWTEYVDQVGSEIAESTPYWFDALNEILARGRQVF